MKQKEKQLLLQDLCARLPYNIIVNVDNGKYREDVKLRPCHFESFEGWDIKPYLHPMSSMTEDEHNDWCQYYHNAEMEELNKSGDYFKAAISGDNAKYDWLNAHHFDYRGLIERGLALEAQEGMYETLNIKYQGL